jgi:malonyl-CoA O-methyltransferase
MNLNIGICNTFNTQAAEYEQAARVQHEIGERLFERLSVLTMKPERVLDLGCGPGEWTKRLQQRYPRAQVVGVDLAYAMLKQAKAKQRLFRSWPLVNGDMRTLPFATGVFDLVFSNQVVHWSDSLTNVMREIGRVMRPSGCLMFSTLGPDTFLELRKAWQPIDDHAHVNAFSDMHDLGDCLLQEQFVDPVMDMELLHAHYATLPQLLASLKAQGVSNVHPLRPRGLTGKGIWQRFEQEMTLFCTDEGKFPLTYEVVYGHAWKGEQRRTEMGTETWIPVSQLRQKKLF